jgi:hypothetical protein
MTRLCPFNGEEDYAVSRMTGRRTPEFTLNGGVLPARDALRIQYGDLMQEAATRTGCGGEGYLAHAAEVHGGGITPAALPDQRTILAKAETLGGMRHIDQAIGGHRTCGFGFAGELAFTSRPGEVRSFENQNMLFRLYRQTLSSQFPVLKQRGKTPPSLWAEEDVRS